MTATTTTRSPRANGTISAYLTALGEEKARGRRKRSPEKLLQRLNVVAEQMDSASQIVKVRLIQERLDIEDAMRPDPPSVAFSPLEDAFCSVVGSWSASKGISYSAWREVGVPAAVLKRAGVRRSTVRS